MDKDVDILKEICGHCRHFCPSQIYRSLGYCRMHNGRAGKYLLPAEGQICEKFSPR
ncbi:hypothetical protein H5T88_03015 [bacterium]|nr:hypothetical protein [bacterium]